MAPQVIPSILVSNEQQFLEHMHAIAPVCNFVQLDIADGVFVSNTTWYDPAAVAEHMHTDFELHLMVADPLVRIRDWAAHARLTRVIVHVETLKNPHMDLTELRGYGKELCLALNPETPLHTINELVPFIDAVQVMSVHPGAQGQPFVPESIDRAATIHNTYPHLPIAADGHVNTETIPPLLAAGVTRFAPGSAIWNGIATKNYRALVDLVHTLTAA